jgi:hypothetical protein
VRSAAQADNPLGSRVRRGKGEVGKPVEHLPLLSSKYGRGMCSQVHKPHMAQGDQIEKSERVGHVAVMGKKRGI